MFYMRNVQIITFMNNVKLCLYGFLIKKNQQTHYHFKGQGLYFKTVNNWVKLSSLVCTYTANNYSLTIK